MIKRKHLILTLFSFILIFVSLFKIMNTDNNIVNYTEVVVQKGDTLWNISMKYTPKSKDIRKTVYEIKKINNINNSIIQPGQILKVPIDN
ncbi:cell division suppressor protein YneA [Thermobrachium celere]|uniref:Peptidoglycan-binding LysM n=1 Tax=Thermobrachium celere DSM 8682 TaxID=941824 RepID=R7RP64_9CLOT|nr:LysM peptidoglycan-binding domain-containing protein [Thermobrachium celere]CDF57982.1 Peptidoglycan-binding LysM [Thermobrachium celere DSM 8682]